jgi:hypothetical protein
MISERFCIKVDRTSITASCLKVEEALGLLNFSLLQSSKGQAEYLVSYDWTRILSSHLYGVEICELWQTSDMRVGGILASPGREIRRWGFALSGEGSLYGFHSPLPLTLTSHQSPPSIPQLACSQDYTCTERSPTVDIFHGNPL